MLAYFARMVSHTATRPAQMFRFPGSLSWNPTPRFLKPWQIGAIGLAIALFGFCPTVRFTEEGFSVNLGQAAMAQSISADEEQRYARSLLAIEPIRLAAYDEIKRILNNRDVPSIQCHRPNSLNRLDQSIRQIAINYCNQAIDIVEENGLTIGRFNAITTNLQNDPDLAARIRDLIILIQQGSPLR